MNNLTSFFGRMTLKQAWENDDSPLIAAGMTKQEKGTGHIVQLDLRVNG